MKTVRSSHHLSPTVLGNFTAVSSMHGIPPGDDLSTDINSSKSCCRCCNLLDPTKPWKFSDKTKWNSEGSTNRFPGETPIYFKISELGFWWCLQSDISAAELLMFQTITATTSNRANRLTKCKRSASLSKTCQIRASHVAGSSIFSKSISR